VDTPSLESRYRARQARSRWRRALEPPAPLVMNPREPRDFPLGRWNLYIGGAGRAVPGYVNLDLAVVPGVDVAADAESLLRLPRRVGKHQHQAKPDTDEGDAGPSLALRAAG